MRKRKTQPTDATPPSWRTITVPIGRLREPPGPNPNVMSPEDEAHLVAAVREKGCLQPILVRPVDGLLPPPVPKDPLHPTSEELVAESQWLLSDSKLEVIDGSHRLAASVKAKLTHVPVTIIEATDAQAAALRVGMNKIRGELDLSTVGQILADLALSGAAAGDIAFCGYSGEEIADLISAVRPEDDEALAMAALGSTPEGSAEPSDEPKRYVLEIAFEAKEDRAAAKTQLKELGEGNLSKGLLALLDAVGKSG